MAVSDSSGTVTAINRYDEYGTPASTNTGRFQYTGQAWLPEIGLHSYKARMYAPRLGRFMQTDTLGYIDGMNLYAYVGNDPVNNIDPSGTEIVVVGCRSGWTCYRPGNQITGTAYPVEHPMMEPYYFGGGGGGSVVKQAPPEKEQQKQCAAKGSWAAGLADRADQVANIADGIALTAGGGALLASPTGIGGLVLGGVALGAKIGSGLSTAVSITAKLSTGNYKGALATGVGFVVGSAASKGYLGIARYNAKFGNTIPEAGHQLAADAAGNPVGKIAEDVICK